MRLPFLPAFSRQRILSALIASLIFASAALCSAATHYVSKEAGASDANPGTLASPWRTLQKAANSANPGDTILVRGGVYPENVIFSRSGTSGNPIVFQAYPSETPIVDGTSLNFANLPEDSLFQLLDVNWITIDGFELRNLRSSSTSRTPKGIFIAGACNGIEILNCRIHDIENNSTTSNGNAHGIAAYGWSNQPIQNLRIEGNELYDLVLGASEALVVNGNVDGFEVIANHVHDCNNIGIDFIGYEGVGPNPSVDRARNGVCRGNLVHHINTEFNPAYGGNFNTGGGWQSAGGIYVDGGVDILIERNVVHHCNIGIELASEHANRWTERIEVRNNVVYLNDIGGLFLGGYNASVGGTRDCVIRHNSFYQNDVNHEWNGEIFFQHETENNVITHNLFFANNNGLFIGNTATSNTGNMVNWNRYHAPGGADIKWHWKGTYYWDFASYRSGTGNDPNSAYGDPLFAAPGSGNFRLQSGSPAIDTGDPAFTADADERDLDGNLRVFGGRVDLGAFEFGSVPEAPSIAARFVGASEVVSAGDSTPSTEEGTDFGYVDINGAPVMTTLLIENPSSVDLDVSGLNLSGSGAGEFSIDSAPGIIGPGNSATIKLMFSPGSVALHEAQVEIVSDAATPSFTFAIQGHGTSTEAGGGGIPVLPVAPQESPDTTNLTFDASHAGVYSGPVLDRNDDALRGRFAALRLNGSGGFTAVLFLEGARSVLRGQFEGNTPFTGQILDANSLPVDVTLTIQQTDTHAGGLRVQATLDGVGLEADATLVKSAFHPRNNPSPWSGRYTMLIPPPETPMANIPEGTGWATVFVAPAGNVRANGQLGDGTNFASSGFVSADGEWFFHTDLYRTQPRGQIGGWLQFRDIPGVSDLDGELEWIKEPDTRERRYPDGFTHTVSAIGCLFDAPARGERTLDELADQLYNAQVSFVETTLPNGGIDRTVSWLSNDRVIYYGPEKLSAATNRRTGMIRGLYFDRESGTRLPFRGVAYQEQGVAAGCFTTPDRAGYLLIEPGTDFPWPGSETRNGVLDEPDTPGSPASGPARTNTTPDADSAGVFSGLLENGGAFPGQVAAFRLAESGAFSAVIIFDHQRLVLRGELDAGTGAFTGQIDRRYATSLDVSFQLQRTTTGPPHAFFLSGTISDGSITADVNLHQSHFHPRNEPVPEAQRGRYTAVLPAGDSRAVDEPQGDGFALVTIAASGRFRLIAKLGDGTAFARNATMFANGEIPIFVPLYRTDPKGYLAGELRLREIADVSDFDGDLRWEKGVNARERRYPDGFSLDQPVVGSLYEFDPNQRSLDGYSDEHHNAWIRFQNASLTGPGPIDEVVSWQTNDRILHFGPERLVVRINRRTGQITGIFDDRAGIRLPLRGVLFQKQDLALGHFLESAATGRFRIDPR